MAARWGSFLQQAVTGIEARLDGILAEEEAKAANNSTSSASAAAIAPTSSNSAPASTTSASAAASGSGSGSASATGPSAPAKPVPGPTRSGSTSKKSTQDRLQERLARAVAAKNANASSFQKPDPSPSRASFSSSPRQSLDVPNRTSIDSVEPPSPNAPTSNASPRASQEISKRPSLEVPSGAATPQERGSLDTDRPSQKEVQSLETVGKSGDEKAKDTSDVAIPPQLSITPAGAESAEAADRPAVSTPTPSEGPEPEAPKDAVQQQQQEDIRDYVEKIDALQAKLQYLAREAAESAKRAVQEAPAGSLERKLAEKDNQIALLMEEGKNLGVTEQKHRTMLKKLRAKIAEDDKEMANLKAARAKADADAEISRRQGRRADDLEKFHEESLKRIGLLQRDINSLRSDGAAKDATISDLKSQLQKAAEKAETLTAKLNDEALEKERQKNRDLEDQVAALQVEKNLVADRAKAQANDLREKVERASERSRVVEAEMKAELQAMEAKLEVMRARAEETSSGALGDSQAKLLRQVETLQTQYSVASDNWQGIEATLLARVTNLEKERDDALQRESDMRKKAREAAIRAKRQEEELEDAMSKLPTAQADIKAQKSELEALQKRAEQAERALQEAKADFERQKAAWKEESRATRTRDRSESRDRRGWLEDMASPTSLRSNSYNNINPHTSNSRPESPLMAPPRTWSTDLLGFQTVTGKLRKPSAPSSNGDGGPARRPSMQPPLQRPSLQSVGGGSSVGPPLHPLPLPHSYNPTPTSAFSHSAESLARRSSPPQPGMEVDDPLEAAETGSSPQQVMQDMVSVSTVAAGPSVQLVERMSAQIRRLESEKVAGKEELARMSRQRDEARAEIVALMREAESGKTALEKSTRLEVELQEVRQQHETALEMLGEKSEQVEELRADVQDVKAMYRDLVERTLK